MVDHAAWPPIASLDRYRATALLDELHQAQNEFYAGGESDALHALLALGITWVVPGKNALAGTYCGLDEVFAYFRRRRDLATGDISDASSRCSRWRRQPHCCID